MFLRLEYIFRIGAVPFYKACMVTRSTRFCLTERLLQLDLYSWKHYCLTRRVNFVEGSKSTVAKAECRLRILRDGVELKGLR